MQSRAVKKIVIGGIIMLCCLSVVLYVVVRGGKTVDSSVVSSSLPESDSVTTSERFVSRVSPDKELSEQEVEQKEAEVADRFKRLYERENKLGRTVTRAEPFVMVPPAN